MEIHNEQSLTMDDLDKYAMGICKKYNEHIKGNHIKFNLLSHSSDYISLVVQGQIETIARMLKVSENMGYRLDNKDIYNSIRQTYTINQNIKKTIKSLSLNYRIDRKCSIRDNYIRDIRKNVLFIYELMLIYQKTELHYGYEIKFANKKLNKKAYREIFEVDFFADIKSIKKPYSYNVFNIPDEVMKSIGSYYDSIFPITYLVDNVYVEINETGIIGHFHNVKEQKELRNKTQELREMKYKENYHKFYLKYNKIISLLYVPKKQDIVKLGFYGLKQSFNNMDIDIQILGQTKPFQIIFNDIFKKLFDIEIKEHTIRLQFNNMSYQATRVNISEEKIEKTNELKIGFLDNSKDIIKYAFYVEVKEDKTINASGSITVKSDDTNKALDNFYTISKRN